MAQNIEVKYRIMDPAPLRERLRSLPATEQGTLQQVDTYFQTDSGRLKLRQEQGGGGDALILYRRADAAESRSCEYHRLPVDDAEAILAHLSDALGVRSMVVKRRRLFLHGPSRIHLDDVEGLGTFVEVETAVVGDEEVAWGEHRQLVAALGLEAAGTPVAESYGDLAAG